MVSLPIISPIKRIVPLGTGTNEEDNKNEEDDTDQEYSQNPPLLPYAGYNPSFA